MAQLLAPFAGDASDELAARLRKNFGSLRRALDAPRETLLDAAGPFSKTCELLLAARELFDVASREDMLSRRVDISDPALAKFIRDRIGFCDEERLLVIFSGAGQSYLLDEEMGLGGPDTVRLTSAKLFRRALTVGAQGIMLAHNHPSGICTPSEPDKLATRELADLAAKLQIDLIDHLIVTRSKIYSMRAGGHFN
uniref:JAB domain-containing protein n=1 Tax=Parerythrobacter lutipelagi TaxID=1964208 RepID=UPI00137588C5|nr:JAB domain-containing protein [Parerythrobacter lutipelagi]